jgi:hypothetical protein
MAAVIARSQIFRQRDAAVLAYERLFPTPFMGIMNGSKDGGLGFIDICKTF